MCKKSIYKRFLNLYKHMNSEHIYDSYIFQTKMGARNVFSYKFKHDNVISFMYHDADNTVLFHLNVFPNGRIKIIKSKIGQPEIFLAIYELEQIITQEKHKEDVNNILEKLFENVENKFNVNLFGFTMYR